MTKAKAATVIAAIVGAGYECRAIRIADDNWKIRSNSPTINVDVVEVIAPFVTAQSITGLVAEVEYS